MKATAGAWIVTLVGVAVFLALSRSLSMLVSCVCWFIWTAYYTWDSEKEKQRSVDQKFDSRQQQFIFFVLVPYTWVFALTWGHDASMRFFEISAQVLAILLLALAVQTRMMDARFVRTRLAMYGALGLVGLIVAGIAAALAVLYLGRTHWFAASLTASSIAAAVYGLVLQSLSAHWKLPQED
jgi:hypothetical protein